MEEPVKKVMAMLDMDIVVEPVDMSIDESISNGTVTIEEDPERSRGTQILCGKSSR